MGLTETVLREMRIQEKLYPAVQVLTETEGKLADSGMAGMAFEGDTLVLYWKGTLPKSMSAALTKARAYGKVEVRPATYSLLELESETQRIWAAASAVNDINYIGIPVDGRGLIVSRLPSDVSTVKEKESGGALVRAASAVAAAGVTVPVEFKTENDTAPVELTCSGPCRRDDDEAAWNSGGVLQMKHSVWDTGYFGHCTAGWAVILNGEEYILTASHCGTRVNSGDWFYDGAGEQIGRAMIHEDLYRELLLIDARGWYWMWDGSSNTTFHKTVHSYSPAVENSWVCKSGIWGTRCDLKTDGILYSWQKTDDYAGYGTYTLGRQRKACRQQDQVTPAGLSGDSGGPVHGLDGDGVVAMGMVTAGSTTNGVPDYKCIYYTNMDSITLSRSTAPYGYWPGVTPFTH
ncbi:MAG: hypothetical protein IRY85_07810 [Micromonosporaceae bacterium]|nr:hypothetical protein [Micromonosporaceae bacterium]